MIGQWKNMQVDKFPQTDTYVHVCVVSKTLISFLYSLALVSQANQKQFAGLADCDFVLYFEGLTHSLSLSLWKSYVLNCVLKWFSWSSFENGNLFNQPIEST